MSIEDEARAEAERRNPSTYRYDGDDLPNRGYQDLRDEFMAAIEWLASRKPEPEAGYWECGRCGCEMEAHTHGGRKDDCLWEPVWVSITRKPEAAPSCPNCRHAWHEGRQCLNMGSDSECSCDKRPAIAAPSGPAHIAQMPASPETSRRLWSMYCRECGIEEYMADSADDAGLVAHRDEHNVRLHAEAAPSDTDREALIAEARSVLTRAMNRSEDRAPGEDRSSWYAKALVDAGLLSRTSQPVACNCTQAGAHDYGSAVCESGTPQPSTVTEAEHFHIWSEVPCKAGQCRMTLPSTVTEARPAGICAECGCVGYHAINCPAARLTPAQPEQVTTGSADAKAILGGCDETADCTASTHSSRCWRGHWVTPEGEKPNA